MEDKKIKLMQLREVMKGHLINTIEFYSDKKLMIQQPPMEKEKKGGRVIKLTKFFEEIINKKNILEIIENRKSRRTFTDEDISIDELAFLLWATQGVKDVIGNRNKAVLKTVPSAGARHPFETYIFVEKVKGLDKGVYRYLPLEHELEFLYTDLNQIDKLEKAFCGQTMVREAAVTFLWTVIPYRTEWRYTTQAAKYALIDVGHVCENLYLACEAINCGTCAIGAYMQEATDELLELDSKPSDKDDNEFVVYGACVGKAQYK